MRFEAWTLPTSATFEKKFDVHPLAGTSGVRALSEYSDETLVLPSVSDLIDEIVTDTTGSWIIAFDGATIVDEFRADRVAIPEQRPSVRQISGPQRNGLVEGIAIYPKNWPLDKEGAQDWKWGYEDIMPDLSLGALGSIREVWEVWHDHTSGQWNAAVDGDNVNIDHDASANEVEGVSETLSPTASGLQSLTTVDDVTVSGVGTVDDPYVITFYSPPDPTTVSLTAGTLAGGTTFTATKTVEGAIDPSPVTKSQPVDAGAGDSDHGDYSIPEIEVDTSIKNTGSDWSLKVNATSGFAGSQIVLDVTPGQTYSEIKIALRPTVDGNYIIVIRDVFENLIANDRSNALTAGSFQDLTLSNVTIPDGVNQIIFRVACDSTNPDPHYVDWEGATFIEGDPEATFTQIVRELLDAAHDRGTAEFLELDATDPADSNGTALDPISFAVFFGGNSHLGHVLGDGAKSGYDWRIVPAADALVITPTGSHVLQIFKATNGEIEDLTASPGGPSITVGGKVEAAETVRRIPPFTTILAHGAGSLTREDTDATTEANMGRIERVFDAEPLGTDATLSAFNTARFAEESSNRKAASAVVLESDSSRPLVDYQEGSKIWWNFGENLPKEARIVRRIAWTFGTETRYEVQGSSRLTPEAAMAKAVDHLLNQPVRRRGGDGGMKVSDLAALTSVDRYSSTIILKRDNSVYSGGAHYICDGTNDEVQLLAALNDVDAGGEVVLMDGFYNIDASIQAVLEEVQGVGKPTRVIGNGAHLNLADGVQIYIQAPTLEFTGFEITRAGTSTNTVIRLANNNSTEIGHIRVSGCKFRDIANTVGVLHLSGRESAIVTGNTFSQVTIANNGAVISKSGTGGEGFISVIGNGFEKISLTGGAGWLMRCSGTGVADEGIFVGNAGENVTVSDLVLDAFAAHNVINAVHQAGDHGSLDHGGLTGLADDDHTHYLLADGSREATFLAIAGLAGATSDSRYVGATASGAPASGTFAVGDYVIAQDGNVYICTTAGSPGTWTQVGAAAATDADAIHDNVAGEIAAVTEKVTPVSADLLLIEDSADSNNKKRIQVGNLPGGGSSPLTTKGDVWGFSTVDARIPIGSDGQVLTADAAEALGLKWATPSGGGGGGNVPQWMEYLNARQAGETSHANDDFFTDASIGGTEVTVSGTAQWTEKYDRLHLQGHSGTGDNTSAILYALTPSSPPVTIETAFSVGMTNLTTAYFGPMFTNGLLSTSDVAMAGHATASSVLRFMEIAGTMSDSNLNINNIIYSHHNVSQALPVIYVRLIWTASNTFAIALSHNGVTWDDFNAGTFAKTMTPTHFGVGSGIAHSSSNPIQLAFEYIRVYEADLSA